ncbi:hypothetical protein A3863_10345 [Priestia endophytica]|uniref:hypothetical protein n=1 Tax=Priestia endophytica TaxID=135735 RepID=UPI000DCA8725|nr:hypothetical protein [Priestia endophytica]RAS89611.1 hypothetical protein A3863_10345 [Priestia endophytica]
MSYDYRYFRCGPYINYPIYHSIPLYRQQGIISLDITDEFKHLVEIDWGDRWRAISKAKLVITYPDIDNVGQLIRDELFTCIRKIHANLRYEFQSLIPPQDTFRLLPEGFGQKVTAARNKARDSFWTCFNEAPSFNKLNQYKNAINLDIKVDRLNMW